MSRDRIRGESRHVVIIDDTFDHPADYTIEDLRGVLQSWEPRVTCPQCGSRYTDRACGPTHVVVHLMVRGPVPPEDS